MSIRIRIPLLCVVCILAAAVVGAEDAKIPTPSSPIPEKPTHELRFVGHDLFGHINGGAELYYELGFIDLVVREYPAGGNTISVEIYRMTSPQSALAIYLCNRGTEKRLPELEVRNTWNVYQLSMVKGDCFIQVNNFSGVEELLPAAVELAHRTMDEIPGSDPVLLLDRLPKENLVPGSELIIRGPYSLQKIYTFGEGDILQMKDTYFGVAGRYTDGEGNGHDRIFVDYPDTETARSAYDNLVFGLDSYLEVIGESENSFSFKDYWGKFGFVLLEGNRMELQSGSVGRLPAAE